MTFQFFPNFWPIFFSTGAFWSASVDPPFKESTDSGLTDLKEKFNVIEEEVGILKADSTKKQSLIERLEFINAKKQSDIDALLIKIDDFEQQKHEPCMQIVGLPENKDEKDDIKELSKIVEEKVEFKLKAGDILEMKRLGKKRELKRRSVIVKFKNKEIKQQIREERKKLIELGNPAKSLYLNDSLTKYRQQLLYSARQLVKQRRLHSAWSQYGNILVRKSENGGAIQVKNSRDLLTVSMDELYQGQDNRCLKSPSTSCRESCSVLTHISDYDYFCDSNF